MQILLHTCCAPCLVVPLEDLRSEGHHVTALFYNPNIHPYSEYLRRYDAFNVFTQDNDVEVMVEDAEDGMEEWLRQVAFRESRKCQICHHMRLDFTAKLAESKGFDAFSTTLLYSRFQKHQLLKTTGESVAEKRGVPFIYRDWRTGWNEGVKKYRTLGLYRQKYCGCIISEKERALKIIR